MELQKLSERGGAASLKCVKLFVCGGPEIGKTSLVGRLHLDYEEYGGRRRRGGTGRMIDMGGSKPENRTRGISITELFVRNNNHGTFFI